MDTLIRPSTNGHSDAGRSTVVPPPLSPRRRRRPNALTVALAAVAAVALAVLGVWRLRPAPAASLTTAPVTQETLVQSVTSSGTVNPQNTISVGTQVSGTISQLYVDYNSKVHSGEVLAKLDPAPFQAALAQAKAALAQAEDQAAAAGATAQGDLSNVAAAQAATAAEAATVRADQAGIETAQTNVTKAQAALGVAQQTVSRDKQLLAQGFIAQATVDNDESNLVAAQSALTSAQAAVAQARMQVAAAQAQAQAQAATASQSQSTANGGAATTQANEAAVAGAQANVDQAELNLQHTIITSPVNGTVIARNVTIGETVAASFQTPTLFTIAQNLGKMEVDLAVGENDIGNVQAGDAVDFSVLAYPNRVFHGTVSQVRVNPTTVSNVVTYDTVVLVPNPDGALLPGMTADASIHVAKAPNALVVPLAALTWQPASGLIHHTRPARTANAAKGGAAPQPPASGSPWGQTLGGSSGSIVAGSRGRVFVDQGGRIRPVPVQITLVSGTSAAVQPLRGTLAAGTPVVTGSAQATAHRSAASPAGAPHGGFGRGL